MCIRDRGSTVHDHQRHGCSLVVERSSAPPLGELLRRECPIVLVHLDFRRSAGCRKSRGQPRASGVGASSTWYITRPFAGLPAMSEPGGTSRRTAEPADTLLRLPTRRPGITDECMPSSTSSSRTTLPAIAAYGDRIEYRPTR